MATIIIFNCKGGVGKTTTAVNLAAAYAKSNNRPVLLIDLDPQCHLTSSSEIKQVNSGESSYSFFTGEKDLASLRYIWDEIGWLIPAHGQLMKLDSKLGRGPSALQILGNGLNDLYHNHEIPLTIIDCCPYVGVLSLNAIFAADVILIPVSADHLSYLGALQVEKSLSALEPILKRRIPRRYIINRFDYQRQIGLQVRDSLIKSFGNETCSTIIFENLAIAESPVYHRDVLTYAPDSMGAKYFIQLYQELNSYNFF